MPGMDTIKIDYRSRRELVDRQLGADWDPRRRLPLPALKFSDYLPISIDIRRRRVTRDINSRAIQALVAIADIGTRIR